MSAPTPPASIGKFTRGVARLAQPGAVELDAASSPLSVADVYVAYLPIGARPSTATISGIPAAGARHPSYRNLYRAAVTIAPRAEQAGSYVWQISVAYDRSGSSSTLPDDPEQPGTASIVRIVGREWPVYQTEAELVTSIDGHPVLDPAGQPYSSVPRIVRRLHGARVVRLESAFPVRASNLDNTINRAAIRILGVTFPAGTARLELTVEDTLAVGSDERYRVTYDIIPARTPYGTAPSQGQPPPDAGWDVPLLDCGYSYRDSDGNLVRATIPDDEGKPTPSPQPVLLSPNGTLLPDGAAPGYTVYAAYARADWTSLALPSTPTEGDPPPDPEPEP